VCFCIYFSPNLAPVSQSIIQSDLRHSNQFIRCHYGASDHHFIKRFHPSFCGMSLTFYIFRVTHSHQLFIRFSRIIYNCSSYLFLYFIIVISIVISSISALYLIIHHFVTRIRTITLFKLIIF